MPGKKMVRRLSRRRAIATMAGGVSFIAAPAIGGANGWGIAGAALFLVSDSLIAETRFVRERRGVPIAIMVTYHLALVGLVLSLI